MGTKICLNCNNDFVVPSNYKIQKFCSHKCYSLDKKGRLTGPKLTFWDTATDDQKLEYIKKTYERYIIKNDTGCWNIKGQNSLKYGLMRIDKNKSESLHRISWIIHKGPIPEGLWVLHHCDNTRCSKIDGKDDHLYLGTRTDNDLDSLKRNRLRPPKGETHPFAKITNEQAIEIKKLLLTDMNIKEISCKTNVSISIVNHIKAKYSWNHITIKEYK